MSYLIIDRERCKGCLYCIGSCPRGLLKVSSTLNNRGVFPVEFSAGAERECTACAMCAIMCPDCAIEVYREEIAAPRPRLTARRSQRLPRRRATGKKEPRTRPKRRKK